MPACRAAVPSLLVLLAAAAAAAEPPPADCTATPLPGAGGRNVSAVKLADGGIAAWSGMNINIDGYGRAYHRRNREAGAVLHLCVGGRVWKPDGSSYEGSESNATCTGKFMDDLARIEAAGWTDPSVGVVQWYGIVADGAVKIGGRTIQGVRPLQQKDGSGFYVSPTSLVDRSVTDVADQARYVDPLRIAAAVVPSGAVKAGIALGSFGVAIHAAKQAAVPFVVADGGPRIGEGSPALARQVAGMAPSETIDLKTRYAGQVDKPEVLWVFFGGPATPFDHRDPSAVAANAKAAFDAWGGAARLAQCVQAVPRP